MKPRSNSSSTGARRSRPKKKKNARTTGAPGQPERYDYEYEHNGVANLFMTFAPLEGWRRVKVTDRRAGDRLRPRAQGFAPTCIFPAPTRSFWCRTISARTRLRCSTKLFPPPKRAASFERFEWHCTPKHGSWPLHGRIGNGCPLDPMPRSPHLRQDRSGRRSRRLAKAPQHPARQAGLAIQNRRRPRQARKRYTLSSSDLGD